MWRPGVDSGTGVRAPELVLTGRSPTILGCQALWIQASNDRLIAHRNEAFLGGQCEIGVDLVEVPHHRHGAGMLDGQDRRLLILRDWQDLPDGALAKQLGVAETTVRVQCNAYDSSCVNPLVEE
jgi:hypothetical protein